MALFHSQTRRHMIKKVSYLNRIGVVFRMFIQILLFSLVLENLVGVFSGAFGTGGENLRGNNRLKFSQITCHLLCLNTFFPFRW